MLERRAAISDALNAAIEIFTSHSEGLFEEIMSDGLRVIAKVAGFDRAAIYQKLGEKDQLEQTYLWKGITIPLEDNMLIVPYIPPVTRWLETLLKDDCIHVHAESATEDEADFLKLFEVKEAFLVPIFTYGIFWGVVSLENCSAHRIFEEDCLDVLSAAARLCANGFIRMKTAQYAADAYVKLLHREQLIEVLNNTANKFLSQGGESFEELLNDGLWPIADRAGVDRIAVYSSVDTGEGKRFGQIYRWNKKEKGSVPLDDHMRLLPDLPMITNWLNILMSGQSVTLCFNSMTEDEKIFFAQFGAKSVMLVPVFMHGEFWGSVVFQNNTSTRRFDSDDEALFHSAAHLCANAIIRQKMKKDADEAFDKLKYRELLTEALNKAAIMSLSQSEKTFEDMMTVGVGLIADAIYIDRLSVWRNFVMPDGLHSSQIYRWDRRSGGTTAPTPGLSDLSYDTLAPRWTDILSKNETINSPLSHLPKEEAALLHSFGVVSAFITPIFVGNIFWGFVLFEDRQVERFFDDDCAEMMRSAAFLFVNTVLRSEMEEKIFSANSFNRAILDSAPISLIIFDDDIKVIDCNEAVLNLFHCERQYLSENFWEFSPETQPDGVRSMDHGLFYMKQALSGEIKAFEWLHRSSIGELIPCEVSLKHIDRDGANVWLASIYDLRNIRRIEEIATEAEELARSIKEASPISYILFDSQMRIIDCNDTTLRIFRCPDKQFLIDNYWDVFLPETQPDEKAPFENALEMRDKAFAEGQSTFERMQRSIDGELIPMENTLTPLMYKGERYIISYKYDMRHTKKLTESVRERGMQLAARLEQQELMADISNGLVASGNTEAMVNEALAKIGRYYDVSLMLVFRIDFGRRKTDLAYSWIADGLQLRMVGMNLFTLATGYFPDELPEDGDTPMIICQDTATSPVHDFRRLTEVDISAFICVPLYVESRLWGFMSVEQCHMPREWKESEEEFIAMTASTLAGAIMRDIYDKERTKALEQATTASRAKGDFLSNMSHEMRTPLNAIIGMTAIGKHSANIERKDYTLNKIEDASANLLAVINDVLDMSKIEANKLELSPIEFNIERMLQKVVSVVKFRMDEKRQQFDVHVGVKVPHYIVSDDQRLSQVITNLLSNACKFTPEDEGVINLSVSLVKDEEGLCTLRFVVEDNGIGISPEQQDKLFHAFAQADSGTSRKFGGTGLGLALCKRIVKLMGGKIWVESERDKGSRFIFTIKAARGKQSLMSLLGPGVKREDLRVFVVDDDTYMRTFIKGVFDHIGIHCHAAAGGPEALRIAEESGSCDIYFIKWRMPGMDGIELTRRLKARGGDKEPFVILISGDWAAIREEALEAGVDKYLMKPLFSSTLVECINECLDVESAHRSESFMDKTHGIFTGKRLLLAEDVEINREILISLLSDSGLAIDEAEDGLQVLKMVKADPERYDLIFMDMQMPHMDGLEATRRIRALPSPHAKEMPIIAMTANVFREDIDRCLEAGMNAHVGKPLDIDDVLAVLRKYLRKAH
ncbi:MAG: response regulator [Oscillospiraceae bacterium]|nr:response regulator [Oscillospiraceae bacterium]